MDDAGKEQSGEIHGSANERHARGGVQGMLRSLICDSLNPFEVGTMDY